jgi:aminocarboxymuconate-semialdehyde decarboxylase
MKIDMHNHFYPAAYLKAVENVESSLTIEEDDWGRRVITDGGVRIVTITEPMTDPARRIEDMDRCGVDMQIISLTAPSVNFVDAEQGLELSRAANEGIAEVVSLYPNRFVGLASVPLKNVDLACMELERAVSELGLRGVCIGSNIAGTQLDAPQLVTFYQKVAELDVPLFIHPMTPAGAEVMKQYRLAPIIGFEFDLTLALCRLVYSGIMELVPGLKIVISHLGGAIPYLFERIDNGYRAYPECSENLSLLPTEYMKKVYYDTVSFFQPALLCAYEAVGAERLVMGSDYPHVIGDLERAVTTIQEMNIPQGDKETILGNAGRLLKL